MMVRNIPQLAAFHLVLGIKFSSFTLDYAITSNHISSVSNVLSPNEFEWFCEQMGKRLI